MVGQGNLDVKVKDAHFKEFSSSCGEKDKGRAKERYKEARRVTSQKLQQF